MSKSAGEHEESIDAALRSCKSLAAEGLWRRMRYVMETTSDRKPHLRVDGQPVSLERLPFVAGCSSAKAARLFAKLEAVGLVQDNPHGILSVPLQRLLHEKSRKARNMVLSRERKKGETLPPKGGNVTRALPPPLPPMVSPPITPSSFPPSPSSLRASADESGGTAPPVFLSQPVGTPGEDDLDFQIRTYIGAHQFCTYDLKTHSKCRQLVLAVGWDRAREMIDDGARAGNPFPVGWALGKAKNLAGREGARSNGRATVGDGPARRGSHKWES